MAKEELKYEEAMATLEQIVARMENNELDLDTMSEQLKKAQRLIKLCKDKLTKTDQEIRKILNEYRAQRGRERWRRAQLLHAPSQRKAPKQTLFEVRTPKNIKKNFFALERPSEPTKNFIFALKRPSGQRKISFSRWNDPPNQ